MPSPSVVHRIRLVPPWRVEGLGDGRWQFVRRFGRPARLGPGERVVLAVRSRFGPGSGTLNGRPLGKLSVDEEHRFDVTDALEFRNQLELLLEGGAEPAADQQPPGEIELQIIAADVSGAGTPS